MKTQEFLKSKREQVIASFNQLTTEEFYNGISLKSFMVEVMDAYARNYTDKKGDVTAKGIRMLAYVLGDVYFDNSRVEAVDKRTNALRDKYKGTAYMSMV